MKLHYILFLGSFILLFISCIVEKGDEVESPPQMDLDQNDVPTQLMNLLENGNCEEWVGFLNVGSSHYLSGWSLRENKGCVSKESKIVYEGEFSAKLRSPASGITAFISQKVEVSPGHRIRIFHRYFIAEEVGNGAKMHCYFLVNSSTNVSNDKLVNFYDSKTLDIIRGGGYGLAKFPLEVGKWQTFDYTIKVPAIAHYFIFEIHSYASTTIYIDDCYVMDLDM